MGSKTENMSMTKRLGIWMDHSGAHLMEFSDESFETKNIESKFTHQEKEESLSKSENLMHHKEHLLQTEYYYRLGEAMKNYDEVILFGPTDAKVELFNTLKKDHHFAKIKIEIKEADKMTENQKQAFVKEHFSKHN